MSDQPPDTSPTPDFNIEQWLASLQLGQYAAAFAENHITPETLAQLTNADLIELGVTSLGHRKTLLAGIQKLGGEGRSAAAAAAPAVEPQPEAPSETVPDETRAAEKPPTARPAVRVQIPKATKSTTSLTPVVSGSASTAAAAPAVAKSDESAKRRSFWIKLGASKVLVLSIVAHLIFGMGATYYIVQTIQTKRKLAFQQGPPNPNRSKRALEHKVSMAQKKKTGGAPPQAKRIVSAGLAKVSLPDMPAMPVASNVVPGMTSGMGGAGFGAGMGFGSGMGSGVGGAGGGGGMSFFGFRGAVQSVVFVIDISGSMISGTKNSDSYERLEEEVVKAINGLAPNAKMDVIMFSAEAHLFSQNMVTAGIPEKARAITWLKNYSPVKALPKGVKSGTHDIWISPSGKRHMGTRSDLALEEAFKLNPGLIFFVSDGEPTGVPTTAKGAAKKAANLPQEILAQVAKWQSELPKKVTINAIAYEADGGEDFMRKLAKDNGGEFKNIKN